MRHADYYTEYIFNLLATAASSDPSTARQGKRIQGSTKHRTFFPVFSFFSTGNPKPRLSDCGLIDCCLVGVLQGPEIDST